MKKLSIIIPYYNMEEFIGEILKCLAPQVTEETEVILVDDGSAVPFRSEYDFLQVVRQENRGLAGARNTGLNHAVGEYISFVDADDLVADNFVTYVLDKIDKENFDYMDLSWRSLPGEVGGNYFDFKLSSNEDSLENPSVCTRIFKRSFIGNIRFNEKKRAAEDEDFTHRLDFRNAKKAVATEYMYFYRTTTPNSLSKQYMNGTLGMKRIVYYFPHVTVDMKYLIEEFKETFEESEILLITYQNDIPELEKYCSVWPPQPMRGMELRGDPYPFFTLIQTSETYRCDVVLYMSKFYEIGGIETFIYNFVKGISKKIVILYDEMPQCQMKKLSRYVRCIKQQQNLKIECDSLIMNRVFDEVPICVKYKQIIQMIHACSDCCDFNLSRMNEERDKIIIVSEAARESWKGQIVKAEVIHNMAIFEEENEPLILVTASRMGTPEKGQNRMRKLAELMNKQGVNYYWLLISDNAVPDMPDNVLQIKPLPDIRPILKRADYLVQLSDSESFCYSIVEALQAGTPVITTDLPVLGEIGVTEKNAHIIPWEIDDYYNTKIFLTDRKRGFVYTYDNEKIQSQWEKALAAIKPKTYVDVEILHGYYDTLFDRDMKEGEIARMEECRAQRIMRAGFCQMVKGDT